MAETDFAALGRRALDTMSPEQRSARAKLAVTARWQRARGQDADIDRKHRLHAALDKLFNIADGDPALMDKLAKALDNGSLVRALSRLYAAPPDRATRLHAALDKVLDSRRRRGGR
jgi:hypothetical protein